MHCVQCPTCGRDVPWTPESHWRPFCSERCRLIDLGDWISERHAIPGEDAPVDGEPGPVETADPPLHPRH